MHGYNAVDILFSQHWFRVFFLCIFETEKKKCTNASMLLLLFSSFQSETNCNNLHGTNCNTIANTHMLLHLMFSIGTYRRLFICMCKTGCLFFGKFSHIVFCNINFTYFENISLFFHSLISFGFEFAHRLRIYRWFMHTPAGEEETTAITTNKKNSTHKTFVIQDI